MKPRKSPLLKRIYPKLPLFLSFLTPFIIVCCAFAVAGVYPFGNRQILSSDGWHQYYPFLLSLREKLLNGGSMEYITDIGGGVNFLSLYAYYVASPLYLLSVAWPESYMVEFFTLMTVLKISLAGLFFALYLKIVYRKNDLSIAFFALGYALCGWAAGYYWNIMWLDTFALLPLLIAGMVCLLRDGRFRLYICALALSLWSNYYIAFFSCIFVFLTFFVYCICTWNGFGNFFRRLLRIGVCTLIGAGIATVLILPCLLAMRTTASSAGKTVYWLAMNLPTKLYSDSGAIGDWAVLTQKVLPALPNAFRDITSRFVDGYNPVNLEGLPNVFCGFITVMLCVFYFCNGKIRIREKLCHAFLLLFLMLSFIFRGLDYLWHGLHFPNMIPYRFAFLIPFVMLSMAFRAFTQMRNFKLWKLLIIVPVSALFLVNVYFRDDAGKQVLLTTAVVLLGGIFYFFLRAPHKRNRAQQYGLATVFLCFIYLCEMILSFALGVDQVGTSLHSGYPQDDEQVSALLDYLDENESELYYRLEMCKTQTFNDGALNGYNGLTTFNSSSNVNFSRFTRALGYAAWPGSNRTAYYENSPFTNTFSGLKYLINRNGLHLSSHNTKIAQSGDCLLLKNEDYIGLGFMTDAALSDFMSREMQRNPIYDQTEMFSLATGLAAELYEPMSHTRLYADDDCTLEAGASRGHYRYTRPESNTQNRFNISFTVKEAGLMIAHFYMYNGEDLSIDVNGTDILTISSKVRAMVCVGDVMEGDIVTFTFKNKKVTSGTFNLDVVLQNEELFQEGMERLSDEVWNLTEVTDTYYRGDISVKEDGLFYAAIPYEPGWTAYVDGVEVPLAETYDASSEDVLLTDAMISFPLEAGDHEIILQFKAPGLRLGALVSGVCLTAFLLLVIFLRKKPVLWPDHLPEETPVSEMTEEEFLAYLDQWVAEPVDKTALRKALSARKKALTPEQMDYASQALLEQLVEHPAYQQAESIYAYLSYNQEVRTEPIIRRAMADGKRVAVPKVEADEMKFLWLCNESTVSDGYKGIPEPECGEEATDENALVLMPGLLFDSMGNRMGYGGGFYDRFLAKEKHPTLALCYDFQYVEYLETESHDRPVQTVLHASTLLPEEDEALSDIPPEED